jgi:uncharacterized lipoprotein NlpE involved in copper resistance
MSIEPDSAPEAEIPESAAPAVHPFAAVPDTLALGEAEPQPVAVDVAQRDTLLVAQREGVAVEQALAEKEPLSVAEALSEGEMEPLRDTVVWLARHAGFPGVRLPAKAEAMLSVAALAAAEEAQAQVTAHWQRVEAMARG